MKSRKHGIYVLVYYFLDIVNFPQITIHEEDLLTI